MQTDSELATHIARLKDVVQKNKRWAGEQIFYLRPGNKLYTHDSEHTIVYIRLGKYLNTIYNGENDNNEEENKLYTHSFTHDNLEKTINDNFPLINNIINKENEILNGCVECSEVIGDNITCIQTATCFEFDSDGKIQWNGSTAKRYSSILEQHARAEFFTLTVEGPQVLRDCSRGMCTVMGGKKPKPKSQRLNKIKSKRQGQNKRKSKKRRGEQ